MIYKVLDKYSVYDILLVEIVNYHYSSVLSQSVVNFIFACIDLNNSKVWIVIKIFELFKSKTTK